jgi:outer membrane protein W
LTAPEEIHNVSHTQLSVARHFGGCRYAGATYHYDANHDVLVRMDVWLARIKEESAAGKAAREDEKAKWLALQNRLF